jgi:Dolichyl-phosphate-mannose-protein mannosyltransferase
MIFVCLALAWLTGFGLVRWLFPGPLRWSLENVLLFSLATGIGIGITSSLYFLVLSLVGPKLIVIAFVEGAAVVAALVLGITARRRRTSLEFSPGPATPSYLTGLLLLGLGMAALMFILYSLAKPHGEWDAWAIWNLRARFLARAGAFWTDAFSKQIAWSHPDYPLLLPGAVALCWTLARTESTAVPTAIAFLFTFGAAGVLFATVGILRGKTQAFIAGTLLLGTVAFVETGATQYADIPLSFFVISTLALLCLQDRRPDDPRFSLLAGLSAGFAAWTKNEGLLFVAAVLLARAIALFRFGNRAGWMRQLATLFAGMLPPLMLVAYFKLRYAPPNDLMSRPSATIMPNLTNPVRWITIAEGFLRAVIGLGSFLIPIALVLGLYWYLVRFKVESEDRSALTTAAVALSVMFVGDFAVYLLLSNDLLWQIGTSIDRLFLQLWPAGVLTFFLAANPPQLAAKPKAVEKEKPAKRAVKPRHRAAGTR